MNRIADALYSLAIALWVGGLFAIGYLAAPILFTQLQDRMLAGNLAGAMFSVMAWVGIGCAAFLLVYLTGRHGWRVLRVGNFWLVVAMLILVLAGHFGIQPVLAQLKVDALPRQVMESALRDRFATWHGISSGLYMLQSLLGVCLVIWQEKGRH